MIKLFNVIVGSLLIFGVVAVLSGGYFIHKAVAAKSWPTTLGIITSSKIVETIEDGRKKHRPKVNYEYLVNSVSYTGNKISIGTITTEAYSKKVTGNYPPGKKVLVFYNIQNPSEALLEVGASTVLYWFLVLGMIFILIPSFLILFKGKILLYLPSTT